MADKIRVSESSTGGLKIEAPQGVVEQVVNKNGTKNIKQNM